MSRDIPSPRARAVDVIRNLQLVALGAIAATTDDPDAVPAPRPAFDSAVSSTMRRREAVCAQRGGEYKDSWALDAVHAPYLDSIFRLLGVEDGRFAPEHLRLIMVAALCDVKLSRMIGPWKDDTLEDLGNYQDALADFVRQYREAKETA